MSRDAQKLGGGPHIRVSLSPFERSMLKDVTTTTIAEKKNQHMNIVFFEEVHLGGFAEVGRGAVELHLQANHYSKQVHRS